MSVINDMLYSPIKLDGKNIDPRYFTKNEDGTYTATPLFVHNTARDAVKYFKRRLMALDDGKQFHTESVRLVKDTWSAKEHNDEWQAKYGAKIEAAGKAWSKYRYEHPDEFETRFKRVQLGGEDEARFFAGYSPDVEVGLYGSVKLYNAARLLASRFDKPAEEGEEGNEYNTLPFEEPLYSKAEFADIHKAFRIKTSIELGIPNDTFEVGKIEKLSCRINNKKCDTMGTEDEELNTFIAGLITHVTSTNAAEFKQKREEMRKLIKDDFITTVNDNVKNLHAEEDINKDIVIYTKPSDIMEAIKIITISKSDDEDDNSYMYHFNITTELDTIKYSKQIVIKSNLVAALEITKNMIMDLEDFKPFVPDIQKLIEIV